VHDGAGRDRELTGREGAILLAYRDVAAGQDGKRERKRNGRNGKPRSSWAAPDARNLNQILTPVWCF
jgi:hypothetical protein